MKRNDHEVKKRMATKKHEKAQKRIQIGNPNGMPVQSFYRFSFCAFSCFFVAIPLRGYPTYALRALSSILTSSASGVRPTTWCSGLSLPLKTNTRGMVVTSYLMARSEFSSTLTLPTLTRPANWSAMRSTIGVNWRHGPHQGAQKSTSTGCVLWTTSVCQLSDVNSTTFLLAIGISLRTSAGRGRPVGRASGAPRSHYGGRPPLVPEGRGLLNHCTPLDAAGR